MPTPAYLSVATVKSRIAEPMLVNFVKASGPALDADLATLIVLKESVADGYISSQYTTPLTGAASIAMVAEWVFALVQYDLHSRGAGSDVREKVRMDYKDAMTMLRDVARGVSILPGEATTSGGSSFQAESDSPVFDWHDQAAGTF